MRIVPNPTIFSFTIYGAKSNNYEKYTYPIQKDDTRCLIKQLKDTLEPNGIYLLGRFAEWEYYNMDVAIGAALDLYNSKLYSNG